MCTDSHAMKPRPHRLLSHLQLCEVVSVLGVGVLVRGQVCSEHLEVGEGRGAQERAVDVTLVTTESEMMRSVKGGRGEG